ncbi:endonuclease/Exonuclease/phosphatase [Bisporella sp. PMI_857]|nr:endonuclease/Exonuclease/phosphatase [Bisporella sp. PMI_857]
MQFQKVLISLLLAVPAFSADLPIRLVSFNIRGGTPAKPAFNEQPWSTRRPLVIRQLSETISNASKDAVTLIGMQEVPDATLNDVNKGLGSEWKHIGVGRDDGKKEGEYVPILYKDDVLKALHTETKWLSPTPDEPSKGWNAKTKRIVTIGVFEHKTSGKKFIAANTHLDHISEEARTEGVKVILERLKAVQKKWGPLEVSLAGDFNAESGDAAYKEMVANGYGDAYTTAPESKRFGPLATKESEKKRIDFLWLGPVKEKKWAVDRYEVLCNANAKDDVYLSDHRAVFADLKLK